MNEVTQFLLGISAIIAAIGGVIITSLKTFKDTKKELASIPKTIKKETNVNLEIQKTLEDLKEYLNADRVQIYDFHNGGHYANGRSAVKTTCTYEVVRSGVKGKQSELSNIPLSCIPNLINKLLTKSVIDVKDIEDIRDDMPSTYALKKAQGIKSFYNIVLNNNECEPIGFMSIQYCRNTYHIHRDVDKQEILKAKFFIEKNLELLIKK